MAAMAPPQDAPAGGVPGFETQIPLNVRRNFPGVV